MQTLLTLGPQVALALGYISGIMTCVNGLVALCGQRDTKVGHAAAAIGVDVEKIRKLFAKDSQ